MQNAGKIRNSRRKPWCRQGMDNTLPDKEFVETPFPGRSRTARRCALPGTELAIFALSAEKTKPRVGPVAMPKREFFGGIRFKSCRQEGGLDKKAELCIIEHASKGSRGIPWSHRWQDAV